MTRRQRIDDKRSPEAGAAPKLDGAPPWKAERERRRRLAAGNDVDAGFRNPSASDRHLGELVRRYERATPNLTKSEVWS